MIRSALLCAVWFVGCSSSDYQGGGRRTDLGKGATSGISLAAGGESSVAGTGSTSAGAAGASGVAGRAGDAGCGAGGEDAEGLAVGCLP